MNEAKEYLSISTKRVYIAHPYSLQEALPEALPTEIEESASGEKETLCDHVASLTSTTLMSGKLLSDMKTEKGERSYRTREDPFVMDWETIREKLEDAPTLDGKALFEWLMEQHSGRYQPGQLRTFQRKINEPTTELLVFQRRKTYSERALICFSILP